MIGGDMIEVGIPVRVPASVVANPDRYRALVEEVRYVVDARDPAQAYIPIPRENLHVAWRVLTSVFAGPLDEDFAALARYAPEARANFAHSMKRTPAAQMYQAISGCTWDQLTDALINAASEPDNVLPPWGEQS